MMNKDQEILELDKSGDFDYPEVNLTDLPGKLLDYNGKYNNN